jgi:hypothetical protein
LVHTKSCVDDDLTELIQFHWATSVLSVSSVRDMD